jgi:hypothetical protein
LAPVAETRTGIEKLNLRRSPMNGTHLMVIALGAAGLARRHGLVVPIYGIRGTNI